MLTMIAQYKVYLYLAALAALMAFSGTVGYKYHKSITDAEQVEQLKAMQEQRDKAVKLNNELSGKVAEAQNRITTKTIEVIKYVPKVTTGKPCLSAAAVSLLQPGADPVFSIQTGEPEAESSRPSSSDTDVATWIAEANRQYDICADLWNSSVDAEK